MPRWPLIGASRAIAAVLHRLRCGEGHALITTIGVRSGRERSIVVRPFPEDSGSILVVAFKVGAATPPSWFVNMARKPESVWIEERGGRIKVLPTTLQGEDREHAWQRILADAPAFVPYRDRGDLEVPIVRLKRIETAESG
jgi:deazaflavin-dependent oxidoreductase (nitroreductase family)